MPAVLTFLSQTCGISRVSHCGQFTVLGSNKKHVISFPLFLSPPTPNPKHANILIDVEDILIPSMKDSQCSPAPFAFRTLTSKAWFPLPSLIHIFLCLAAALLFVFLALIDRPPIAC